MAYRSGTYVAFHAEGTSDPTESDMKYYRLVEAWKNNENLEIKFINSHDKANAVRDTSLRRTLEDSLLERLRNSKNLLLIIGETTKNDQDWIPFEISRAVDDYKLPLIVAYTGYRYLFPQHYHPVNFRSLWPSSLARRIDDNSARVIHIPFRKEPVAAAINQFGVNGQVPNTSLDYYISNAYSNWNLFNPLFDRT
ncbi:TIR domain-containing protein [Candidatus Gottesmanbacteria bacterium]|nr:TIR domain-containing protein [Candidatus Gottesmanbacteria bacterium]